MKKSVIISVPFTKVTKLKFPSLVNEVVEIVARHNPETLHLSGFYNQLLEVKPQVKTLLVVYKKHPNTQLIKQLMQQRRKLFIAINAQKKAAIISDVQSLKEQRALVVPFLDKYLRNIVAKPTDDQSEHTSQMFQALEGNTVVIDALTDLGWKVYLDELKEVQHAIELASSQRVTGQSIKPQMQTKQVKSELSDALANLLQRIELAQKEYKELDYSPLIKELNELLRPIAAKIKARSTRSQNQLAVAKASADVASDTSAPAV